MTPRPPQRRIHIAEPSVKSLLIEMRVNGQVLSGGTGFVANAPRGPVLVTNRHNVTGRNQTTAHLLSPTGGVPDEVRIFHNSATGLGQWLWKNEPLFSGNQPRWIEHPTLGEKADFVALPLTQLDGVRLFPYTLHPADLPEDVTPYTAFDPENFPIVVTVAEVVSVVGFPFGLKAGGALAIWATGFVATDPDVDFDGLPVFLIDCRGRPGQSGSAVIAYRPTGVVPAEQVMMTMVGRPATRLLGIYSGRVNAESDLGFVWKTAAINELVETIV